MKVAAGIPSVSVAHCEYNRSHIEQLIAQAAEAQAEIAVFPELCLTGYTCQDLFFQQHLLEEAELSLMKLADATRSLNIISIVGLPLSHGGALYNCAAVIFKGKILGIVPKSYLPNYKEFYEMRWFASGLQVANTTIGYAGQTVPFGRRLLFQTSSCTFGVEICEDVWAPTPPSSEMVLEGAEVIFNLSADNDVVGKNHYLQQLLVQQSARCLCGYVFASSGYGESTQDVVFGGKAFVCEDGHLLAQAKRFSTEEQLLISEIDVERVRNERMTNTTFTSSLHKQSTYDTIDSLAYADYGAFSEYVQGARGGDLVHNSIQLAADRIPCPWCQCYAIWVPDDLAAFGMTALEFYRGARDWFAAHTSPDGPVTQVRDARDIDAALEAGKVAALLTIENGLPLQSIELIDEAAADGVKMVTLTWNAANPIAHGSQAQGGITSYGHEALRALEDRRMVVDVSHLNDESFWDVARAARRPFAASHSNARSVCGHERNLTDDQFRAIVDAGGVVGINYFRGFISDRVTGFDAPPDGEVTFDELAAHIERFLDLGGEGAIALGSDFDGSETPEWLDACEKVAPFHELVAARFGKDLADRMFWSNAHDFFVRNETA